MKFLYMVLALLCLGGCVGVPEGILPVREFELDRYLGKWYEIARLDHPFERGLQRVTAEYTLRGDGGVRVVNRGFSPAENAWKQVEGKAYFVRGRDEGFLKVSFFGPFYGAYVVFELDREGYQYAFVTSSSRSFLWLLARSPRVSGELKERFVARAKEAGFAVEKLIFVRHEGPSWDGQP